MLLHGIFPPVPTPFYPDGSVYYKKLEANVTQFSKTPAAGIVVLGWTGEAIMLSDLPQATGYDIPNEIVAELAQHPNLIGIKESSGSVDKVRRMVAETAKVTRTVTVTETFEAVTGRMLRHAARTHGDRELVPV